MAAMEDVLDLYAEPYDPDRPVVCFDETSDPVAGRHQAAHPSATGTTAASGLRVSPRRHPQHLPDLRTPGGLATLGDHTAPHHGGLRPTRCAGWWMRLTLMPPVVRVVLDNLNTHRMASLYETFAAAEARRIVKRLEFHHTHPNTPVGSTWRGLSSAC